MIIPSIAFAMAPPADGGGGNPLTALLPFVAIFAIFYFLLIRPQQKRAKEHKGFLDSLERGQEVITAGGLIGKITGITEKVITLEIADNVRVKVARSQIGGPSPAKMEKE